MSIGDQRGMHLAPPNSINEGLSSQFNYAVSVEGKVSGLGSKGVHLEHKPYEFVDGKARVIFSKKENELLAEKCRLTIVGKFPRNRPQIDIMREDFKKTYLLKGSIKIGAYDWRHIFIDFTEEEDFKRFYGRRPIQICGTTMRIQRWTRKFKDDMESTLAPVWVTLPEPLWHYHNWEAMEQILEPIGTLISLDKATMARTRPTTAKA